MNSTAGDVTSGLTRTVINKHYTAHIFEKDFLVKRWRQGKSYKLVDAVQEQIQTNFRRNKVIEEYKDIIINPKTEEDYQIIFYLLKDINASKSKLEETIKILPLLLRGIPDDDGSIILFDEMPLRKYKPIEAGYEET